MSGDGTCLINLLSWLPGHSGFGSYVQRVVPGIEGLRLQLSAAGETVLVPSEHWSPEPPPWAPSRRLRWLQRFSLVQHGVDLQGLWQQQGLVTPDWATPEPELIYSPFFDALLCWPEVPQLITCHDLTPLVASNSRKAWLRYRFWQPRHCRTATRIIAISRYVADQLVAFGVPAAKLCVIPNGIQLQRPPITAPASDDLLALARHDVNKNLPALFRGVAQLQRRWPQWQGRLRIIGRGGRQTPLVRRLQRQLPRPEQVELLEALPQEQLVACLRTSLALISASSEEGFDYPVLEAKAEGLPTLISDIPVHREFHEGSSLFFPTGDEGVCFADQVQRLRTDANLWQQLSRQGVALAQSLSVQRQQNAIREQLAELGPEARRARL